MSENKLSEISKVISKKYFHPTIGRSTLALTKLFVFGAISYGLLVFAWNREIYILYPLAWFLAGTFLNSMFVIAHDCGHFSFFRSRLANLIVGQLIIWPTLYPFYAWIVSHNGHHKYAGNDRVDPEFVYCENAWRHYSEDFYEQVKSESRISAAMYRMSRYFIVLIPSSFAHLFHYHYRLKWYKQKDRNKVLLSQIFSVFVVVALCSAIYATTNSIFAVFYFYVIPFYLLHQQFSLTTYIAHIHQTSKEYCEEEWTPYSSRVNSTFNVYLPRWMSFLLFNIDVHVPHHISTAIPCYYLRLAQDELGQSTFAKDIIEEHLTIQYYFDLIKLRKGCGILLT